MSELEADKKRKGKSERILKVFVSPLLLTIVVVGVGLHFLLPKIDILYKHLWYQESADRYKATGLPWVEEEYRPSVNAKARENFDKLYKVLKEASLEKPPKNLSPSLILTSQTLTDAKLYLAKKDSKLTEAAKMLRQPIQFPGDPNMGSHLRFPHLSYFKAASSDYLLKAEILILEKDDDKALQYLECAVLLAKQIEEFPNLVTSLTSISIRSQVNRAFQKLATHRSTDVGFLKRLLTQLDKIDTSPDLRTTLKGEAFLNVSTARNIHIKFNEEFIDGLKVSIPSETLSTRGDPATNRFKALAGPLLDAWADTAKVLNSRKTIAELRPEVRKLSDRVDANEASSNLLAVILFPVYGQTIDAFLKCEAEYATVKSLLKVAIYKASGMDLDRAELEQLIEDDPIFIPSESQNLKVAFSAELLKVYSLGPNQKDDGGLRLDVALARERERAKREKREARTNGLDYDVVAVLPWNPPHSSAGL